MDIRYNTSAQSDWNQNDESKFDYVKNRTHWVGEGEQSEAIVDGEFEISQNQYLVRDIDDWDPLSAGDDSYSIYVEGTIVLRRLNPEEQRTFTINGLYTFTKRLEDYNIYTTDIITVEQDWYTALLLHPTNVPEEYSEFAFKAQLKPNALPVSANLTCKVVTAGTVHQLDDKYISSNIARVSQIPTCNMTIKGSVDTFSDLPINPNIGDTYDVKEEVSIMSTVEETILNPVGTYRLPTVAEFDYVLNTRNNARDLRGRAVIKNVNELDTKGYMLMPDDFVCPTGITFSGVDDDYTTNIYTLDEFKLLEKAGAIFLPCAGFRRPRSGVNFQYINIRGYYWTSTYNGLARCFANAYDINLVTANDDWYSYTPMTVRLVYTATSGFNTGEGTYIQFTKGNLHYNTINQRWFIAQNQYDMLNDKQFGNGEGISNVFKFGHSGYNDKLPNDFTWGTGGVWSDITGTEYDYGVHNSIYGLNTTTGLKNYPKNTNLTWNGTEWDAEGGQFTTEQMQTVNSQLTTFHKNKLETIAWNADANVQSDWNQTDTTADDYILNKPTIPTKTSDLSNDSGFITSDTVLVKTDDTTDAIYLKDNTLIGNNSYSYTKQYILGNEFDYTYADETYVCSFSNEVSFNSMDYIAFSGSETIYEVTDKTIDDGGNLNFKVANGPTEASGKFQVVVGRATGEYSTAIGDNATARQDYSVAINGEANGEASIAIGSAAWAEADDSIAIGDTATVDDKDALYATAIGGGSYVIGKYATAIGAMSEADDAHSTAMNGGITDGSGNVQLAIGVEFDSDDNTTNSLIVKSDSTNDRIKYNFYDGETSTSQKTLAVTADFSATDAEIEEIVGTL